MGTYPGTGELAAFRRSIAGHADRPIDMHPQRGAWRHELGRGIGYREMGGIRVSEYASATYRDAGIARREASAMRSRAYARGIGTPRLVADEQRYAPCSDPAASDQGNCPEGHPCHLLPDGATRACGTCSYFGRPVYDAPFWDDEQPRSPLPIAYRNPISAA